MQRLLQKPKDFKYSEAKRLLEGLGYIEHTKGKTSGSRVAFYHKDTKMTILMHKRHPDDTFLCYMINDLIDCLRDNGHI